MPEELDHYKPRLVVEGEELPDATLTHKQREHLKHMVWIIAGARDHHELAYLSNAFEAAARMKRDGEEVVL